MRFAALFVLALFLPTFTHAASPTLTTYTVSHDTIYPSASATSGLATTTAIDVAFSEPVKASIKITSTNGALIKSLYTSSSVTNPTPKIWDGTNANNTQVAVGSYTILISATSTVTGLSMTDSSKTINVASLDSTPSDTTSDSTNTATTTTTTPSANSGGPPEYIPVPTLRIITGRSRTVSAGADTVFTAVVYDSKGNKRDDALITWSFGDGMKRTGASVFHRYYDSGEYVAVVHTTTPDGGDALNEIVITVKDASIKIASISSRGISITNNSPRTLDLSLWRLSMGGQEFKIPSDTQILSGRTILFPSQIIQLPIADSASLLYPSGEVAATYPEITQAQLSASQVSFNEVQTVEPIISTKANIQTHEVTAVNAPTATTELAAVGAALPTITKKSGGIFSSPWTLSFLGVIALAGAAFIFI